MLRCRKWWLRTAGRPVGTRRRPVLMHLTQHGHTYSGMVLVPWNNRLWQCRAPSLKGAHLLRLVRQFRKKREGNKQTALSSHPETSAVLLVFTQWSAEGLGKKKPKLQEFLKREEVDIICIQETHLTDSHRFTIRGCEFFRHDCADRHKGGIVTLVWNTILLWRSGDRRETLSTLPSGSSFKAERSLWSTTTAHHTKTCNYTLFHWSATSYSSLATSVATLQAGDMRISIAEESKYKIRWLRTVSSPSKEQMISSWLTAY